LRRQLDPNDEPGWRRRAQVDLLQAQTGWTRQPLSYLIRACNQSVTDAAPAAAAATQCSAGRASAACRPGPR
jgi:hypothetical protein